MSALKSSWRPPNYREHKEALTEFIREFDEGANSKQKQPINKKYWNYLEEYAENRRIVLPIEIDDLLEYTNHQAGNDFPRDLVENVCKNTSRYIRMLGEVCSGPGMPERDIHDVNTVEDAVMSSRAAQHEEHRDPNGIDHAGNKIPDILKRRYEIAFIPPKHRPARPIRLIKASDIGSLVKVRGIVTRITEVRPFVRIATYVCSQCGCELFQPVGDRNYVPLTTCTTPTCQENKNLTPLREMTRGFKFTKFQECKLQELPEEVPIGNVPRSLTVYLFGENTRTCQCGDKIAVNGIWLPLRQSGWKAMKTGLKTQTYLHAMSVERSKKGYSVEYHSEELMEQVQEASEDPEVYSKLARSLAPEFYGLENVKKALLCLLIAGVTKTMKDGLKIRGDINVLLMGDPGVAKSQLLRAVCRLAPRAVYTTGQGSSGVGLTAAVLRDKVSKDMVLEAGALVLADMGICCIDEFDKMEEADRSAIHEVMEQQTVSIAKAGVTTTLNARTAIMAAANPAFGRYNKKRTPEQNINLPAALLSRFDLVWVMVDRADHDRDLSLAKHIAYVHQHNTYPALDFEPYTPEFIRAYIAKARTYEPVIPKELTEYIVMSYVQVRQSCLGNDGQYDSRKIIGTPRALLSILRLSQALARMRFADVVTQADVEEAMRLMTECKKSTLQEDEKIENWTDTMSRIFEDIKEYLSKKPEQKGKLSELQTRLALKYTSESIQECIQEYEDLEVLMVNERQTHISLLSASN